MFDQRTPGPTAMMARNSGVTTSIVLHRRRAEWRAKLGASRCAKSRESTMAHVDAGGTAKARLFRSLCERGGSSLLTPSSHGGPGGCRPCSVSVRGRQPGTCRLARQSSPAAPVAAQPTLARSLRRSTAQTPRRAYGPWLGGRITPTGAMFQSRAAGIARRERAGRARRRPALRGAQAGRRPGRGSLPGRPARRRGGRSAATRSHRAFRRRRCAPPPPGRARPRRRGSGFELG